jgi:hypothetical protein
MAELDTEPHAADRELLAPASRTGGPPREAGRREAPAADPPRIRGIQLTRTHRILAGVVITGVVVIAAIGFAGSYAAVRTLALHKGFGWFANVFPIGVDAGIVVLLALDLLLTWLRIPFPLLRQTAWLLTAATIAFNGAAAWPDPLGVGMHAIIPVLFVVSVEAARHAIGRVADITADKHMEGVRLTRWLLAPLPTFKLWRRMKLWELRSYEEVIRREQDRLVYRARLRARYGAAWRRRAPIEAVMPLRLARYGVPLADTAAAGLEAAGIEAPAAYPAGRAPAAGQPGTAPAGTEHQRIPDADAARPAAAPDPDPTQQRTPPRDPEETERAYPAREAQPAPGRAAAAPEAAQAPGPRAQDPGERAKESVTDAGHHGVTDPTGHRAPGIETPVTAPVMHQNPDTTPAPAPTRLPAEQPHPAARPPRPTTPDPTPDIPAPRAGDAAAWTRREAPVTDPAAATARVPEQESDETPVSDLTEEQRLERIVQWLAEAEAAGQRLSGAEAARRNAVSPSTGQRDMRRAKSLLAQRQREQGRAHLRSVPAAGRPRP